MTKDPTEAPPNSVLAQVLLDSGSLAGDFIIRDMLLRLQGEAYVYKTAQPLKVCSRITREAFVTRVAQPKLTTDRSLTFTLAPRPLGDTA